MTLWTLTGFSDVMCCELAETPAGHALRLHMGDKPILAELWPSVEQARARAAVLRGRLLGIGWIDSAG